MINIKIQFPYNVDGAEIVHTICERLKGDLTLFANSAIDKNEKTILISLGDDADQNPRVVNVEVNIHAVDNVPI